MQAFSSAPETPLCRVLSSLYGGSLRLLPERLRSYRADMDEVFRHRIREERRRGAMAALLFFASSLADIPSARRARPDAPQGDYDPSHPTLPTRGDHMERFNRTIRLAVRALLRRPGYSLTVAVTLALGIASVTTVFSLVNAVNMGAFPYPDTNRIVFVSETIVERGNAPVSTSWLNFESWRAEAGSFDAVVANRFMQMPLIGDEDSRLILVNMVSDGYFDVLGASAVEGRLFDAADIAERNKVAIISPELWQERFASDPDVVGRGLRVGGQVYTVTGVMAEDFFDLASPTSTDVWLPAPEITEMLPVALENRRQRAFQVLAKLAPGVSVEAANDEMSGIAASLTDEFPEANEGFGAAAQPLREGIGGTLPDRLLMLLSGAAGLMLVACINVAGIVMVRGTERRDEIAMHRALGASGFESASGLVAEACLLALAGGLGGIALAYFAVQAVMATEVMNLPAYLDVGMDLRVLGFAMGTSLVVGIVAGVFPAVRVASSDLRESLVNGGGRAAVGKGAGRGRAALVVAEVAAAVLLIVGAGLLLRSVQALRGTDVGFRTDSVVVARVELPRPEYPVEAVGLFAERLGQSLEVVPGIEFAHSWGPNYPFNPNVLESVLREGESEDDNSPRVVARYHAVSPGSLQAMQIPLLVGRAIDERDRSGAVSAVAISESLAEELWPGQDPLGRRLGTNAADGSHRVWHTVVGVVQNARLGGRQQGPGGIVTDNEIYYSIAQRDHRRRGELILLVGHDPALTDVGETLREAVAEIAPQLPVHTMQSMADVVGAEEQMPGFTAQLMMVFGGLALFMAALGIYGVLAQSAAQRYGELGLRKALGASNGDIFRLMIGSGLKLTALGVLLGIFLTAWANQLLTDFLFATEPGDPGVIIVSCALLFVVATLATLIPTLRAVRVPPSSVLRDTA